MSPRRPAPPGTRTADRPAPARRRPASGAGRVRLWCSRVHLWVGLALGLVLVVVSVTGSALVFRHEIDRALNPALLRVEPSGERVPPGALVTGVEEATGGAVRLVRLPRAPDHAAEVWLADDDRRVYADPYTGAVLGVRGGNEGAMNALFALHAELLGGEVGARVVGVVGLLTVLLAATGLVLWWPTPPTVRRLRKALAVVWRRGPWRLNYDLHRAGGFWTAGFLVLVAATGSALVFYDAAGALLHGATGSAPPPPPPTVAADEGGADRAALDGALDAARRALPDGEPTFLALPQAEGAPLAVRLKTPSEWHPNGRSYVYLAPATGRVLRVDDARDAPAGARLLYAAYPLHVGAVGGGAVRALYVLLGLAPAALSATGVLIWYRRWRRRHRRVSGPERLRAAVPPGGAGRPRPAAAG